VCYPNAEVEAVVRKSMMVIPGTGDVSIMREDPLDYESLSSFGFEVIATDSAGATAPAVVWIDVIDVNEAPEWSSVLAVSMPETSVSGYRMALSPLPIDHDAGDCGRLEFTLKTPSKLFEVEPLTGAVVVQLGAPQFNFEGPVKQYEMTVTARDRCTSDSVKSTDALVTVSVTNVNEAPVFIQKKFEFAIAENTAAGHELDGVLRATDVDHHSTLTFP
jgi:hypothetical protein